MIEQDTRALVGLDQAAPPGLFGSSDPTEIIHGATARAEVLAEVIRSKDLAVQINDREHVRIEGWTLLGSLLGVFPVTVWSKPTDTGWEARVEARTLAGAVVGAAEAECSREEATWAKRPGYMLRSMAQTRATSKALRMPLGFVMTLAGYDPTPAEEMVGKTEERTVPQQPPPPGPFAYAEDLEPIEPEQTLDVGGGVSYAYTRTADPTTIPICGCGERMVERRGVSKAGKPYHGWFCDKRRAFGEIAPPACQPHWIND